MHSWLPDAKALMKSGKRFRWVTQYVEKSVVDTTASGIVADDAVQLGEQPALGRFELRSLGDRE
ncbi:MAG: hypothetical protein WBY44_22540, partial [Bryobacteraceae bacterium]